MVQPQTANSSRSGPSVAALGPGHELDALLPRCVVYGRGRKQVHSMQSGPPLTTAIWLRKRPGFQDGGKATRIRTS